MIQYIFYNVEHIIKNNQQPSVSKQGAVASYLSVIDILFGIKMLKITINAKKQQRRKIKIKENITEARYFV